MNALVATDNTQGTLVNAFQGLNHLPVWRQIGLIVALAGSVALGVMVALWSQSPDYTLLYGSLTGKDAAEVAEVLEQAGIPFRVGEGSSAVLVPSNKVDEARLKLAGHGLPRGSDVGFELLDKSQSFGTSRFLEQIRYQRALEGELSSSIATLNSVEQARVHLALPKRSVFLRDRKQPSASVLLHLYPGRELTKGQVSAVTYLVASAIPNLEPSEVQVVDQMGKLLTGSPDSGELTLGHKELEYTRVVEEAYIQRIEKILSPVVGAGGSRAQVAAQLDFTRTEQSSERFDPEPRALLSEQVLEERGAPRSAGGIPGALSNQPPGAGRAPEQADESTGDQADDEPPEHVRREATRNYEISRTVRHTHQPFGALERLSVAVVVDDRRTIAADGTVARQSRSEDELKRITALVKEAVGFTEDRGDRVRVVNIPFTALPAEEPPPQPPLWEQPWVWRAGKQLGGALLVLLLVFGVLRPLVRHLAGPKAIAKQSDAGKEPEQLASPEAGEVQSDRVSLSSQREQGALPAASTSTYHRNLDSVKSLVQADPKRVANVMRHWINERE